jgi:hypothetical protein
MRPIQQIETDDPFFDLPHPCDPLGIYLARATSSGFGSAREGVIAKRPFHVHTPFSLINSC